MMYKGATILTLAQSSTQMPSLLITYEVVAAGTVY